jgi:hypothetical protein
MNLIRQRPCHVGFHCSDSPSGSSIFKSRQLSTSRSTVQNLNLPHLCWSCLSGPAAVEDSICRPFLPCERLRIELRQCRVQIGRVQWRGTSKLGKQAGIDPATSLARERDMEISESYSHPFPLRRMSQKNKRGSSSSGSCSLEEFGQRMPKVPQIDVGSPLPHWQKHCVMQ